MKPNEQRLVGLLALVAAICCGAILSQSLLRKQRQLDSRAMNLELKQQEASAMMAEAGLWHARHDWLKQYMPPMTSGSQATQDLLQEMLAAAAANKLTVQKQQLLEATEQAYYTEVGVTLTMLGDLPDFFRWLHGMLSPESFRMVSMLKIVPDTQDKAKMVFTVRLNRRFAPALTAVEEPQKEVGS